MKALAAIALGAILCLPVYGFGQPSGTNAQPPCPNPDLRHEPDMAFCEKDSRPEIKAFCKKLARLQTYANANPGVGNECFRALLLNLDLTADLDKNFNAATPTFIYATGAAFAARTAVSNVLRDVGQVRPDQQLGSGNQASGTTSLVAKAGSAELISLAMDAGVLTKSVNGTTTTLSTNADQVFRLITASDPDCTITCKNRGWFENRVLNFTNVSATFDVAQTSSTTTPTTGQASGTTPVQVNNAAIPSGAGKLSSITARYQLMNRFDPRGDKFKQAWREQVPALSDSVSMIGEDTEAVFAVLKTHSPWSGADPAAAVADQTALSRAQEAKNRLVPAALADITGRQLVAAFESLWQTVVTTEVMQDSKLAAAVGKAMQDRAIYRTAWLNALDKAVGNLLTVQYSFNRPVNQPQTHDLKLIFAYNFGGTGMLTFNGAASLYGGALPAGAQYGRLHYGQVSAQFDRTLSSNSRPMQTQLSLAGYWQYQPEPSVLNIPAGTVAPGTSIPLPNGTQEFVGTAGSLWVTQAKLTIKGSGGINIPIGVSWSNKTDLLNGSKIGGQVGISYNFASLGSLLTGSSTGK